MSKALTGAAMLAGAFAMGAIAFMDPLLILNPMYDHILEALIVGGVAMEAGAIADALASNRGMNITTRQPAAFRQIIYGTQRVGGVMVYESTTGSHLDQYNMIIVLATHEIDAIENLYLDGRRVFWTVGSSGNTTRNGVNFGGLSLDAEKIGPGGAHYNFGHKVYCEARFGDQANGDVIAGMTANDPTWAASAHGSPYLGGCAYVYLKIQYDASMFPQFPEIKFTVRGKNNIVDPRIPGPNNKVYTTNWALIVADVLQDDQWGLGDVGSVNTDQLIAAANVCDEQVALAKGGTESRWACHWHYDTSAGPGDILQTMMPAAAGRLSRIGGEWFIWPAYWQGPTFTFDKSIITGDVKYSPYRKSRDLFNRVNGTYTAPNFPYNVAGNMYDANGWYDGTETQNNFPFAFQPTNYPQYAVDTLHGYASDIYLEQDGGIQLPTEVVQNCVLSVSQAQRAAKIHLLRNRQQGSGSMWMGLEAWQMQPLDVMIMDFPEQNWNSKQFEIASTRFQVESQQDQAQSVRFQVGFQETDQSVYAWSTTEELTVYDVPANPQVGLPYIVPAPTSPSLSSSSTTAILQPDGSVTPRLRVSWVAAADASVTQYNIQYQVVGAASWLDAPPVSGSQTTAYVAGVVSGLPYNVQIQAQRANGATSAWVQASVTVSAPAGTMVGDGGSGGQEGNVPAPLPGDAAAGKFLKADGTWEVPSGTGGGGGGTSPFSAGPVTLPACNGGVTYTLPATPLYPAASWYIVNGIKRIYGTYYTISGNILTILIASQAPDSDGTHELYAS
jgi:hypothetical protein